MASETPLNLAEIDPPVWRVLVKDKAYGPYTLGQMRGFILEGRVTRKTKIAEGDGGAFKPAGDIPRLSMAFGEHLAPTHADINAPANYVIVAQLAGEDTNAVTGLLNSCGIFAEIASGLYVLRSRLRLAKLREAMDNLSNAGDRIIIINASNGRLAWLGLGQDADAQIRSVWDTDLD